MSIHVSNLSKSYATQKAVDQINLSIRKGEIVGFLGPNGAGKSTVMKILTGYLKDFDGEVLINDLSVKEFPLKTKKGIGYLPEHNPLYLDMYVREYLSFNAEIYKIPKNWIAEIIEEVGLSSQAHKRINELSKGYRQRVGIAAALLHDPDVLILDEPTTGLDPNQLVEIRALIKRIGKDKTVLFSTHILQEVEAICDRVIIINKGKIVADRSISSLENSKNQFIEVEFDQNFTEKAFENLQNLSQAIKLSDTIWNLTFSTQLDMRSQVFDFANENAYKILNLSHKNKNLENLFSGLTQ